MSKTLADVIAENETLYVNCSHTLCWRTVKLDVHALADSLGADHGAMHDDLVKLFRCTKCYAEGRDQRPVFFTYLTDYEADRQRRNARPGRIDGKPQTVGLGPLERKGIDHEEDV